MKNSTANGQLQQHDVVHKAESAVEEESDRLLPNSTIHNLANRDNGPQDRFLLVYSVFFMLGVCSVLPWNMFITATVYFRYKFRNLTGNMSSDGDDDTPLQAMFESYFAIAAMVPAIIFQLLNLLLQYRFSQQMRIVVPLFGMLFLFTLTTILTKVDTDEWQTGFFAVCMASVVLINVAGAVYQGSMFGLASILPKRYMQAIMSGQGMGGILPSLLSIISIAATSDPDESGLIYFSCSVVCIIVTIVAFFILPKLKYAAYYLNLHAGMTKVQGERELEDTESFEEVKHHQRPPFWEIFLKIKLPAISILIVFAVTLGLFPGTLVLIRPINTRNRYWANDYFIPVSCFLVFNTMDFTGRLLSVLQWPGQHQMGLISILTLLRLVFFPLFTFCNLYVDNHATLLIFDNDAYFIVFNVLFGLTNGYLGSLIMIYGPKFVEVRHSETAGIMMSLFLAAGLALGAVISVLFLKIV